MLDGLKPNEDDEGNKVIRPVKIFGTITNKAEMGLVETQGENYVRNSGILMLVPG